MISGWILGVIPNSILEMYVYSTAVIWLMSALSYPGSLYDYFERPLIYSIKEIISARALVIPIVFLSIVFLTIEKKITLSISGALICSSLIWLFNLTELLQRRLLKGKMDYQVENLKIIFTLIPKLYLLYSPSIESLILSLILPQVTNFLATIIIWKSVETAGANKTNVVWSGSKTEIALRILIVPFIFLINKADIFLIDAPASYLLLHKVEEIGILFLSALLPFFQRRFIEGRLEINSTSVFFIFVFLCVSVIFGLLLYVSSTIPLQLLPRINELLIQPFYVMSFIFCGVGAVWLNTIYGSVLKTKGLVWLTKFFGITSVLYVGSVWFLIDSVSDALFARLFCFVFIMVTFYIVLRRGKSLV